MQLTRASGHWFSEYSWSNMSIIRPFTKSSTCDWLRRRETQKTKNIRNEPTSPHWFDSTRGNQISSDGTIRARSKRTKWSINCLSLIFSFYFISFSKGSCCTSISKIFYSCIWRGTHWACSFVFVTCRS